MCSIFSASARKNREMSINSSKASECDKKHAHGQAIAFWVKREAKGVHTHTHVGYLKIDKSESCVHELCGKTNYFRNWMQTMETQKEARQKTCALHTLGIESITTKCCMHPACISIEWLVARRWLRLTKMYARLSQYIHTHTQISFGEHNEACWSRWLSGKCFEAWTYRRSSDTVWYSEQYEVWGWSRFLSFFFCKKILYSLAHKNNRKNKDFVLLCCWWLGGELN